MSDLMTGWYEISCNTVTDMKRDGDLELPWNCELTDSLYCYKTKNQIIAIIKLSQIPEDN